MKPVTAAQDCEVEGHWWWEIHKELRVLQSIDEFLWTHLGPGHGMDKSPPAR